MKVAKVKPTIDYGAPKDMMGIVSEGMMYDMGYDDGIVPVMAVPEKPVPNGTRVG